LSPFFNVPLPSQFLHFCFFLTLGPFSLAMLFSKNEALRATGKSATWPKTCHASWRMRCARSIEIVAASGERPDDATFAPQLTDPFIAPNAVPRPGFVHR